MNRIVCISLIVVLSTLFAAADETIDKLAARLERVPGRTPAESIETMQMTGGFEVQLVASEPLLRDPVAVDFDEAGRMYVCELPQYNAYAVEGFEGKGSVKMLVDEDDDGRYDKATIFAGDLDYPTAVACWDGGVFIGVAPDLIYAKDTDGDGVADSQTVVLTGFGKDKAGEAHLNSFRWGFDNRLHFSTNLAGGEISIPGNPNFKPVQVRGRGIILDPRDLTTFELTSGGGQHGMSMDNWGHKFVCSNSVPAQTLMYDDRYLTRNPRVRADAPAVDIAPDGKFTRLFRISPDEPWRKLRTQLRKDGKYRGSDEGGKPFGFFTGATGITIYRGDAWPDDYRGNLLVGDVANNLIYRARLDTGMLRPVAHRADAGAEFLAAADIWFRPVQMANAPDGTIYVLDIYRELIEGAAFLPPEFIKYLDPTGGNDRGRIYRLAPPAFKRRQTPRLRNAATGELVALLDHANGWHRDTASRLLYERQDSSAIRPLKKMFQSAATDNGRMTALYSLQGLSALDERDVLAALEDRSPVVRAHALKLAESFAPSSPAIVAAMCAMTSDPDIHVRYQLAFSLGSVSSRATGRALAAMMRANGASEWVRLAVLTSLESGAGRVFAELCSDQKFRVSKHGAGFLMELATQIGAAGRSTEIATVLKMLQQLPAVEREFTQQLVQSLVKNQNAADRKKTLAAASGRAGLILAQFVADAQKKAVDTELSAEARVEAIHGLRLASLSDVRPLVEQLLTLQQGAEIQSAVVQTLGEFPEDSVAEILLERWPAFSPSVRAEATETILSRPHWIRRFLAAIEDGSLRRSVLEPARAALLKKHPDREISQLAQRLYSESGVGRRADVVKQYQAALSLQGDVARGKAVFKKNCSVCHRLEGVGTAIGADLKAIRSRGLPAVLLNILDPNREVKPQFQAYTVITTKGKTITGMILSESANSMTIRRPDGTSVDLQRSQVEELNSSGLSFMPEGLEQQINVESMADLLAYLDSIR